jgi:hypothetical protein
LAGQRCHYLLAVVSPLPVQEFSADTAADLPVKLGELGIDGLCHALASSVDQLTDIGKQRL